MAIFSGKRLCQTDYIPLPEWLGLHLLSLCPLGNIFQVGYKPLIRPATLSTMAAGVWKLSTCGLVCHPAGYSISTIKPLKPGNGIQSVAILSRLLWPVLWSNKGHFCGLLESPPDQGGDVSDSGTTNGIPRSRQATASSPPARRDRDPRPSANHYLSLFCLLWSWLSPPAWFVPARILPTSISLHSTSASCHQAAGRRITSASMTSLFP